MPLARIDLATGKSADYRKTIGEVVYQAMVETLKAPKDDRFQIDAERGPNGRSEARLLQGRGDGIASTFESPAAGRVHQSCRGEEGKLVVR
jgi:hypothetical protein